MRVLVLLVIPVLSQNNKLQILTNTLICWVQTPELAAAVLVALAGAHITASRPTSSERPSGLEHLSIHVLAADVEVQNSHDGASADV